MFVDVTTVVVLDDATVVLLGIEVLFDVDVLPLLPDIEVFWLLPLGEVAAMS